jgi:hypothetical protein
MGLVVWAGVQAFFSCIKGFFGTIYDEEVSWLLGRPNKSTSVAGLNTTHATETKRDG